MGVDLFFIISGFVILMTYNTYLKINCGLGNFTKILIHLNQNLIYFLVNIFKNAKKYDCNFKSFEIKKNYKILKQNDLSLRLRGLIYFL